MKKNFYLTKKEVEKIKNAGSFHELVVVARTVLNRMDDPVAQVCGPISTGNKNTVKKNLDILNEAIEILTQKGVIVFNQLPFERAFDRIMNKYEVKDYDTPILYEFYGPIFELKKIKKAYFIPGWRNSIGAKWEYRHARKVGIKTILLDKDWKNFEEIPK